MGRECEPGEVMQCERQRGEAECGSVSCEMQASSKHMFEMCIVSAKLCVSLYLN